MNFQVAQLLREGGPLAPFFLLLGLVIWMRLSGRWVTEKELDRTVSGYVETNKHLGDELKFWRTAAADKDKTIQTLADQNSKLMVHSAVSAHALQSITGPLQDGTGTKEAEIP